MESERVCVRESLKPELGPRRINKRRKDRMLIVLRTHAGTHWV